MGNSARVRSKINSDTSHEARETKAGPRRNGPDGFHDI
jgi:hypothetical protein